MAPTTVASAIRPSLIASSAVDISVVSSGVAISTNWLPRRTALAIGLSSGAPIVRRRPAASTRVPVTSVADAGSSVGLGTPEQRVGVRGPS